MPAPGIKHKFVSGKADSADPAKVRPSKWNEDHDTAAFEAWIASLFPQTSVYFEYTSTVLCTLRGEGGAYIWIDGVNRQIDSGTTLAIGALSPGTAYNVYAYWDATANTGAGGVRLTAVGVGTAFTRHSPTNIPQLAAAANGTLVGRVIPAAGPTFVNAPNNVGVISYWNRKTRIAAANSTGSPTFTTATETLLTGTSVAWIDWGEESVSMKAQNVMSNDADAISYTTLFADGGAVSLAHYSNHTAGRYNTQVVVADQVVSAAYHTAEIRCRVSGGTMTSYIGTITITYRG